MHHIPTSAIQTPKAYDDAIEAVIVAESDKCVFHLINVSGKKGHKSQTTTFIIS